LEFRHRFIVKAPLAAVKHFHSRSSSMGAITPPPVFVQFHQAPAELDEGSEMRFTLWMGPIPIHWQAQIENVHAGGFDDRQLKGPFRFWVHHHTFIELDPQTTVVEDSVEAELHPNLFLRLVGFFMWLNMPLLFAYRGWKTRRLLERAAA
jgi:ligand-binding SRPBCC domain-containing protein